MTTGKHLLTFRRVVIWNYQPSKVEALQSFVTGAVTFNGRWATRLDSTGYT